MSSTRGRGGRNSNRGRGPATGESDSTRPPNQAALIKTVCDATSWPKDDVEKALVDNGWNPDSTVDAILAGVYGKPTEEWHVIGSKPKKKPNAPESGASDRAKSAKRSATPTTQKESENSGADKKQARTPRAGFSKKAPAPQTANPPKAETPKQPPQTQSAPKPTANKWASGAPSFQVKKEEGPVQPPKAAPKLQEPPKPQEPVVEPKPEPVQVQPEPAPPASVVVDQAPPAEPEPVQVTAPPVEVARPKTESKPAKGDLISAGATEGYPEMSPMMFAPGVPPEMFFYPAMVPHFPPQEAGEEKGKEGEAGLHPQPQYMPPYPFYPPYYPPYGMGQFGGQPQYFPPNMYKQAFPGFPQGQNFSDSEQPQAPPMFYPPPFPLYPGPPPGTGEEGATNHGFLFDPQHPAIPPMMMPPPRGAYPGPFGQPPHLQAHPQAPHGQRTNRQ